ncbi:MAG: PAS domain-containing protein [bacterium]
MPQNHLKLRHFIDRRTIAIAIIAAVTVTTITVYFIHRSHRFFIGLMGEELKYLATELSNRLNADAHATIQTETDMGSAPYKELTSILEEEQLLKPDIKSAYTLRIVDDTVHFIISPPADLNNDGIISGSLEKRDPVGFLYDQPPPPEMVEATLGRASAGNEFVKDMWGVWLSGCAPLKKADGTIDGAVCVDADAGPMISHMLFVDFLATATDLIVTALLVLSLVAFLHARRELEVRRKTERDLAGARRLFDAIFEHAPLIAMQSYDAQGMVHLWNRASEQMYGIPRGSAVGKDIALLLLEPEQRAEFKHELAQIVRTRRPSAMREWKIKVQGGRELVILSTMSPTVDDDGSIEIFCMDIDVTQEKNMRVDLERQIERFKILQESLLAREGRLIEMKKEVNDLLAKLEQPPKYVV